MKSTDFPDDAIAVLYDSVNGIYEGFFTQEEVTNSNFPTENDCDDEDKYLIFKSILIDEEEIEEADFIQKNGISSQEMESMLCDAYKNHWEVESAN